MGHTARTLLAALGDRARPHEVSRLLRRADVVPLVAVSGAECIDALSCAGFSLSARSEQGVTLTKGLRSVLVPDVAMLTPEELTEVLRSAGIAYSEFLDLLSEAPTDPAISRMRPCIPPSLR